MAEENKYLGQEAVQRLIAKTKETSSADAEKALADAKAYTDEQALTWGTF